jgi:hypothetical protein
MSERAIRLLEAQFLYADFRPITENGALFRGVITTEDVENKQRRFRHMRGHSCLVGGVYWMAFAAFSALLVYFILIRTGYISLPKPGA